MKNVRSELSAMGKTVRTAAGSLTVQGRSLGSLLRERLRTAVDRGIVRLKRAGERTGWRRV